MVHSRKLSSEVACGPVCVANALVGTEHSISPDCVIRRAVAMQIFPPLEEAARSIRDGELIGTSPSDLLRLVKHFTRFLSSDVSCISVNPLRESATASWANYLTLVQVAARGLLSIAYVDGARLKHVYSDPQAVSNNAGISEQPNSHCVLVTRATVDDIQIINPDSGENGTWERMTLNPVAFIGCWRSLRGNGERTVATAVIGI